MITFLLILLLIYIALGIIGFVVKGLFWLFVVACVLFVATIIFEWVRRGRGARAGRTR